MTTGRINQGALCARFLFLRATLPLAEREPCVVNAAGLASRSATLLSLCVSFNLLHEPDRARWSKLSAPKSVDVMFPTPV